MAGGMQKYTVQEVDNASLGQGGSIYCDGTSTTAPTGSAFVAITVVSDAKFSALTKETAFACPGLSAVSSIGGDEIVAGDEFPAGVTIYGRWTTVNVSAGAIVAYIG